MKITLNIGGPLLAAAVLALLCASGCASAPALGTATSRSVETSLGANQGYGFVEQDAQPDYRKVIADPGWF